MRRTVTLAEWDAAPDERVRFWGGEEQERLSCEDLDEAIGEILEECDPAPDEVVVVGFARLVVTPADLPRPSSVVEYVLDDLDSEYGDPNGGGQYPTEPMLSAARTLLAVIAGEYRPWACEEVIRVRVDVPGWVARAEAG